MARVPSRDGTQIAFTKGGEGPALVIVSGALSQRALPGDTLLVPRLMEHFTVYTYDPRGRGQSGDTKPYALDREIEDIEALIDHAGGTSLPLRRLVWRRSVATGGREAGRSQSVGSSRCMIHRMVSHSRDFTEAEEPRE